MGLTKKQNASKECTLSATEISQRVEVLRRFKKLLEQQRSKFREYLQVLEAQEVSIVNDEVDKIIKHAQLEQAIISEISSIQKVIDPLENMCRDFRSKSFSTSQVSSLSMKDEELETAHIKQDLEKLKLTVLAQNQKNTEKLKVHIAGLRNQISQLKTLQRTSSPFSDENSASLIDIEA